MCRFCKKQCKNGGGLTRHIRGCRKRRLVLPRVSVDVGSGDEDGHINILATLVADREEDSHLPEDDTNANSIPWELDEGEIGRDGSNAPQTMDVDDRTTAPPFSAIGSNNSTTISSLTVDSVEVYPEERGAGMPVEMQSVSTPRSPGESPSNGQTASMAESMSESMSESISDPDNFWRPFESRQDYALAQWFLESGSSDGDIDKFFRDVHLQPFRKGCSFDSAKSLRYKMQNMRGGGIDGGWTRQSFQTHNPEPGAGLRTYHVIYFDIMGIIKAFLAHKPFDTSLHYRPIRQRNANGARVYSEIHTADWWWETQDRLPNGSTVVPIILASDKTHLSRMHGDQHAWPVYITIGNLQRDMRRAHSRPGMAILGMIPIVAEKGIRAEVYHYALGVMTEGKSLCTCGISFTNEGYSAIKECSEHGVNIQCADGLTRRCHPILAAMTLDYEEQAMVTSILTNRHCPTCTVPPTERERLCPPIPYPKRTPERTAEQLRLQKGYTTATPKHLRNMVVHDRRPFTDGHFAVDIYRLQSFDILHSLMVKGLIGYLLDWWLECIRVTKTEKEMYNVIDARFRAIPRHTNLRRITSLSKKTQWTGEDDRTLQRTMMATFAPILIELNPDALHAGRAILDLVILARYRSHDDDTIRYLLAALARIDLLKEVFRPHRPLDKATGKGHFNFPKFHSISHIPEMIRSFGPPDGLTTQVGEKAHVEFFKNYYARTNKHDDYIEQIMRHDVAHVKMITMRDLVMHQDTEVLPPAIQRAQEEGKKTEVGTPLDLHALGWQADDEGRDIMRQVHHCNSRYWRTAGAVAEWLELDGFLEALAAFIRTDRMKSGSYCLTNGDKDIDTREADCGWVERYPVRIHSNIRCWKALGENSLDIARLSKDIVVCRPLDQPFRTRWRRDCAWVHEYDQQTSNADGVHSGKLVGEVLVVVEVMDLGRRDFKQRPTRLQGVFMEIFNYRHGGQIQECHGMEVERARPSTARNPRSLGKRRFYSLASIERSAHVVPASVKGKEFFYINSFVDFDQYNSIYDQDFLNKSYRAAKEIHARYIVGH